MSIVPSFCWCEHQIIVFIDVNDVFVIRVINIRIIVVTIINPVFPPNVLPFSDRDKSFNVLKKESQNAVKAVLFLLWLGRKSSSSGRRWMPAAVIVSKLFISLMVWFWRLGQKGASIKMIPFLSTKNATGITVQLINECTAVNIDYTVKSTIFTASF